MTTPESFPVPPAELMKLVGSPTTESYLSVGRNLLGVLKRHAGLKPSDRVLDVGCGCGRLAAPLANYLAGGSYDGFDVVPELIAWCRDNISARRPDFCFEHIDIANTFYRERAGSRATEYRFPHADDSFDVTVLTSVFTHMLRRDLLTYLAEIVRTLKPGGTALMSFFLLNDESRRMKEATQPEFRKWRLYGLDGVRVLDRKRPEAGVAYPEQTVRALLRKGGLEVQQILFGSWCGRRRAVSGQDIIIARKPLPRQRAS